MSFVEKDEDYAAMPWETRAAPMSSSPSCTTGGFSTCPAALPGGCWSFIGPVPLPLWISDGALGLLAAFL
jgi:hypothetical protein